MVATFVFVQKAENSSLVDSATTYVVKSTASLMAADCTLLLCDEMIHLHAEHFLTTDLIT